MMAASSAQGSQDPARPPRLAADRPYQISEKNTFLHVGTAFDSGFQIRRQVSAPASTSTSQSLSKTESESTLPSLDSLPGAPTQRGPAEQAPAELEQALSDSGDEDDLGPEGEAAEGEEAPQEGRDGAGRRRRNVRRPCKSQRERFRKLKGYLEADVQSDPHGFDFSKCYLPPSVAANPKLAARLEASLEEYRNMLLSEGGVPVAGAALPSSGPSSLPAAEQARGSRDPPSQDDQRPRREHIVSL